MLTSDLPERSVMYQTLLDRDRSFEGVFYVGVKTTGIFCKPTCRARKPKEINTEYFKSSKDALAHGYRACKICQPMNSATDLPAWVSNVLDTLHTNPTVKIRDYHLRDMGVDPVKLRRWFIKHHEMTFHSYQRSVRINHAFSKLQQGDKITDTAYDSGFESLSGFNSAFKKITETTPSQIKPEQLVTLSRMNTPLGPMMAGATASGICLLEFTDRKMLETQFKRLKKYLDAIFIEGTHPFLDQLQQELISYFEGKTLTFSTPLHLTGTDFQKLVWTNLQQIEPGTTRSYQEQATACGNPKGVRAVAKANGDNKISILIPCHRVIGSDGKLTGYGGGLWRKKWLLDHELDR